ncbi:glycosyltransferase involved in cell wall biosynthesis [Orenia metallireducens]|uniref:Glycosyltransferase involved in cell wall bisynthesis n=1 Tax=Orenia metallireducens TaxID=1413210 RepID=A0A285GMN2_9FIRM|nr:glycosyltransferase family 2 protein [Orenia metallireducens]PRX35697.1 glycosyltransferase involved in cell wall biosynthesis [Orenia metallireducens]SNY24464.1 Glycosyltransferase involved in cell wall bisynthesis [Orenia metallireducens]
MDNLGALILTYNEEDNIEECLETLNWINDIVVIDSYSNDNTVELAKKYTQQVYQRKFDDFASQRNFGLEQIEAEWVLVVDADERVTPALKDEILNRLNSPQAEGYKIPRKNYFLGKWIKYCGWYPDYTLRLFKAHNRYSGLVHEGVKVEGRVDKLNNALIHYTYRDLKHYLSKINHYTTLDAEKKYKASKKIGIAYIILRPIVEFIKKFILKKGFLLGMQGFILSVLSSYYQFLKYIKLWEKNQLKLGREK